MGLLFLFACSSAPQIAPEWKPFWELSKIENQTSVQSHHFPDSIRMSFLWEYQETLSTARVQVVEEVIGKTYNIEDFQLDHFGLKPSSSVLFMVDESGSMRRFYDEMDSLLFKLISEIPADSFSIARFGGNFVAMDKFYTGDKILLEIEEFKVRADPDGTKLIPALYHASDLLKNHETSQKAIVLITDDSFSDSDSYVKIKSVMNHLKDENINIIILSTGQFENNQFSNMAYTSDGIYVYDVFEKWKSDYILSLIKHSYSVKYKPEREYLDGQVHQIVVHFDDYPVKRYGKYRVPGEMLPEYREETIDTMQNLIQQEKDLQEKRKKEFQYPKILLLGLRVPFNDIDNQKLSSTAKDVLDSLVSIVNQLPDEYAQGKFHIRGYTCNLGSSQYNLVLSKTRAATVKKYLQDNIANGDFVYISNGFGETNPIRENENEETRKLNRRVEIDFIKPIDINMDKPDTLSKTTDKSDSLSNIEDETSSF